MNRAAALKVVLGFVSLILLSGVVLAQDDTRTFEITNDILISRVRFTYSQQLAQDAVYRWVPASQNTQTPTGPIPEYTQVVFQNYSDQLGWQDSGQYINIYPTVTFPKDSTSPFTKELANLKAVLAARPNVPDQPLPMLPFVTASQIIRTHVQYLDFPGGSGIRYGTAAGLDVSPLSDQVLFYTVQGLTTDGAYYIAATFPVKSGILPAGAEQMNAEQYNQFAATYDAYLADVTQKLNTVTPQAFSPDLNLMDGLFASMQIIEPTATILTPEGVQIANGTYGNVSFSYDASLASRIEVDVIPPFVDTPEHMTMFGSEPEYTVFSLFGYPITPDNNYAKFRAIPVDTFPAPDTVYGQALAKLKDFLNARPALTAHTNTSAADNAIPMIPVINAAQVIVAKPAYLDFQNGFGARFITFYSQAIDPVTNGAIYYAFIGMTSDGKYVVSAQLPVFAPVLPEIDYKTLDYDAFATNYASYLAKTLGDLDGLDAQGYNPVLDLLDNLIRSLKVGA
jgi:hypothetical protein